MEYFDKSPKLIKEGRIEKGAKVVVVVTGNGLKDPSSYEKLFEIKSVELDIDKIFEYLGKE